MVPVCDGGRPWVAGAACRLQESCGAGKRWLRRVPFPEPASGSGYWIASPDTAGATQLFETWSAQSMFRP